MNNYERIFNDLETSAGLPELCLDNCDYTDPNKIISFLDKFYDWLTAYDLLNLFERLYDSRINGNYRGTFTDEFNELSDTKIINGYAWAKKIYKLKYGN